MNGDTLINSLIYKKVYAGTSNPIVTAAIRNDIVNKKVYQYSVAQGSEKLLYDFNLSVGDTVFKNNGYGFYFAFGEGSLQDAPSVQIDTAWVTSIDSVIMPHDGLYHRRFNFMTSLHNSVQGYNNILVPTSTSTIGPYSYDNFTSGYANFYIKINPLIEGVGQLFNPVSVFDIFENHRFLYLSCASINDKSIITFPTDPGPWGDSTKCHSLFTGIKENSLLESDISIFPNPTNGKMELNTKRVNISYIEITNVLGEVILKSQIVNQRMEINLSEQKNGIYFIRVYDKEGNSVVQKIIKQ